MLKRFFWSIVMLSGVVLMLPSSVLATSGCCSSHGGVNCSAGPQGNGKVVCNDGNTRSSCDYSEMVMCGGQKEVPREVVVQKVVEPKKVVVVEKKIAVVKKTIDPAVLAEREQKRATEKAAREAAQKARQCAALQRRATQLLTNAQKRDVARMKTFTQYQTKLQKRLSTITDPAKAAMLQTRIDNFTTALQKYQAVFQSYVQELQSVQNMKCETFTTTAVTTLNTSTLPSHLEKAASEVRRSYSY